MFVRQRQMLMLVTVRFSPWTAVVSMLMVLIVLVFVGMSKRFMGVAVRMVFAHHQPGSNGHQDQRYPEKSTNRLMQEKQREAGTDEWRRTEMRTGTRAP